MINARTQLNLVIGYPLTHTQSPKLHKEIYRLKNCNAVLLAHETQDLAATIHAIKTLHIGLVAVTMPHKENIIPYLDKVSPDVKKLKSANTIINHNNILTGYNTDIHGIQYALRHISLTHKTVLIIGAGGAARAAAYVLQKNKATLLYLNRTPEHAQALSKSFGGNVIHKDALSDFNIDIIINTTPIGMYPTSDHSPLPDYDFKKNQIILDMVYNPVDTRLLLKAKSQGAHIISGQDMFLGQALKQVELYMETL